jgi:chemotaxis signal transduction protein
LENAKSNSLHGTTTDSIEAASASSGIDTISSLFEDYQKKIKSTMFHGETPLICFSLGNHVFGLDAANVHNILGCQHLIPVPVSPPYLLGAFGYGGRAVAMIDLSRFLDIGNAPAEPVSSPLTDAVRVLVLHFSDMTMAFHVDRIHGFLQTSVDGQDTSSFSNEGRIADFVKRELVIGRIVVLMLDTEALFMGARL